MRLIDADALKRDCRDILQNYETRGDDYGIGKCGGMTQAMNEIDYAPTIDAIPMWWITEKFLDVLNKDKELSNAVWLVRKAWQKEQEAQDG